MRTRDAAAYCRKKAGATEGYPFGPEALVFKVGGKMFALVEEAAAPARISLKCDPGLAEVLRQTYSGVTAGYHMNKEHWNSVLLAGDVPAAEVREFIDQSYELVVGSLPRRVREGLSPPG